MVRSIIDDGMTIAANLNINASGEGSVLELKPGHPAMIKNIKITPPPVRTGLQHEIFVED